MIGQVDEENRTIRVEPMVSMGDITNYLLPRGYSLPIVPELDDLTVGGMINGLVYQILCNKHVKSVHKYFHALP